MSDKHWEMYMNFIYDCRQRGVDKLLYRAWLFELRLLFKEGNNPMEPDDGPTENALKLEGPLKEAIHRCFMEIENDYYRLCSKDDQIEIQSNFHDRFLREEFCKVQRELLDLKEGEWIEKVISTPEPLDFT